MLLRAIASQSNKNRPTPIICFIHGFIVPPLQQMDASPYVKESKNWAIAVRKGSRLFTAACASTESWKLLRVSDRETPDLPESSVDLVAWAASHRYQPSLWSAVLTTLLRGPPCTRLHPRHV